MQTVTSFLHKINYEIGRALSQLDSNSWIVIGFVAFVIGVIVLRGNSIRR